MSGDDNRFGATDAAGATGAAGAPAGRGAGTPGRRGEPAGTGIIGRVTTDPAVPADDALPAEPVDHVLAALADPTRRRLLDVLAATGSATATVLADRLPVSRQAIVKHLAVLDAAGLVTAVKVGREVRYAVRPAALTTTARWMAALAADWDRRLATIKRLAEAAEAAARAQTAAEAAARAQTAAESAGPEAAPPETARPERE